MRVTSLERTLVDLLHAPRHGGGWEETWRSLQESGIDLEFLVSRSMLSPATCCLVNPDGDKTVEKAFEMVQNLSSILREQYNLL